MKLGERRDITQKIIELLNEDKLDNKQKRIIFELILNLKHKTPLQKERFSMYYGLGTYEGKRHTYKEIAKIYNVTSETVYTSVCAVIGAMYYFSENEIEVLENILQEYYQENNIPDVEFEFDERKTIIDELLEIARNNYLSSHQKNEICRILNNIKNKTYNQLERFILFYNLKDNEKQYKLQDLAALYKCTPNAIKGSIKRTRQKLLRVNNEDIYILKNILEETKQKHDIQFVNE